MLPWPYGLIYPDLPTFFMFEPSNMLLLLPSNGIDEDMVIGYHSLHQWLGHMMLVFPGGFVYLWFRALQEMRRHVWNKFSPFDVASFPHEWMQLLSKWKSVDSSVSCPSNCFFPHTMELTWIFSTYGATDETILTPGLRRRTLILSSGYLVP